MRIAPVFVLLAAVSLAACERSEAPKSAATPAPAKPAVTQAPAPAAGSTGVAECDDYLAKYEACLADKVPEAARAALRQSLDATRAGWNQVLSAPGGKESLKTACVMARDSSRASLQAYGCTNF